MYGNLHKLRKFQVHEERLPSSDILIQMRFPFKQSCGEIHCIVQHFYVDHHTDCFLNNNNVEPLEEAVYVSSYHYPQVNASLFQPAKDVFLINILYGY